MVWCRNYKLAELVELAQLVNYSGEFVRHFGQGCHHASVYFAVWRDQRINFRKQQLLPNERCAKQWHNVSQILDCGFATSVAWRTTEHTDTPTN